MSNITWLDFNNADEQNDEDIGHESDEIKRNLLRSLPQALQYLLPNGKIVGDQFVVGNLRGDTGKSLKVELKGEKAGVWFDFEDKSNGDIFDLWAAAQNMDCEKQFFQLLHRIKQWLFHQAFGIEEFRLEPQDADSRKVYRDELGPPTGKWDYHNGEGKLIACVYRYDTPEGKEFRPWDVVARRNKTPNPRPLYNQPGILDSDVVVLVEGEKCAEALIKKNITATTAMNGSNAPVDKTDWTPLRNKKVIVWPDNDATGKEYAEKAAFAIAEVGASLVTIMAIPKGKPKKWDSADAIEDGDDVQKYLDEALASIKDQSAKEQRNGLVLSDWLACERFIGEPQPRQWLVEGIFPLAQVSLLAASGGVGKSFLLAQLAREVAAFNGFKPTAPNLFGAALSTKGTAVYITAEDDAIEMHIRLNTLGDIPDKFYVIPLPDAGGAKPLFAPDPVKKMPTTTAFWDSFAEQLRELPDLRVVIFDPLQPLCALDFNVPENAQFVCSKLSALAAETGASVIVSHHFAKREASTPEQAREAIRGTGGLVDGVRSTYALWMPPVDRAQEICKTIDQHYERGSVVMGGVVKANGRANLKVTVFIRDAEKGILVDKSYELAKDSPKEFAIFPRFIQAISQAAVDGKPYTKTGQNGVYDRRFELPQEFHKVGKHKLVSWVDQLQSEGKLVAAMAPGQTLVKWLDVPNGPVALGEAEFVPGHIKGGEKGND